MLGLLFDVKDKGFDNAGVEKLSVNSLSIAEVM